MKGILYLHGFLSSPASAKARLVEQAAAAEGMRFAAPDLNAAPSRAACIARAAYDALVREGVEAPLIVGSSLGGYYAARLSRETDAPAVLVNPCLEPQCVVARETGLRTIYGTDRTIEVKASFADEFSALSRAVAPRPSERAGALVLLSTRDEVLDYREALERLGGFDIVLVEGDDRRMSRFAAFLPAVVARA